MAVDPPDRSGDPGRQAGRPMPKRRGRLRAVALCYLALVPLLGVLVLFQYYPAGLGIFRSFWDWKPAGESTYIGLENYRKMMSDEIWWKSFANLVFLFVWGVLSWGVPLLASELLITLRSERAQFVFRTILIVPIAFPGVVTALVWSFMYHPNHGVINRFLDLIGLGWAGQNWAGDPDIAMLSLVFVGFPWISGLPFLIIYSALRGVGKELFEAAELDGCGRFRRFWTIDLPLLGRQFKVLFFLGIVATLQYGFMAYIVTGGGPANATMVPVLRMIDAAYTGQDWGYAATLATALFVITVFFSVIVVFVRRDDPTSNVKGM